MLLLGGLILTICSFNASETAIPTLSVPPGTEGSQLTLTCQYSALDSWRLFWYRRSHSTAPLNTVGVIYTTNDKMCVPYMPNWEPDSTLYSFSCSSTSMQTLTVRNLTSSYHGEIWHCTRSTTEVRNYLEINSNSVTIIVEVQVTIVALSPSTDVTTVILSQPASFECTVPRSLPNATIVWYRNSSGVISFASNSTSYSYSNNSDRTVRTIGRLTLSPKQTDNGVGFYCTASSGGASRVSRQIMLNVHYESSVDRFGILGNMGVSNITVNENVTSTLACYVNSNPGSTITLLKDGVSINNIENSRQFESAIRNNCTDAGVYTCSSINEHNKNGASIKNINYYVKCTPRQAPDVPIEYNLTSARQVNTTLSCTVIAYPPVDQSHVLWQKCNFSGCFPVNKGKLNFSTRGFGKSIATCNLTLLDVQQNDYGQYKLTITEADNKVWSSLFYLNELLDKPDPPTEFTVINESVTESSANTTWKSGFNGGLQQTFHLQYRLDIDNDWTVHLIPDQSKTETQDTHFIITGLRSNSKYIIELFSSNAKGNSSFVEETFSTLTLKATVSTRVNGGTITGGVVGGLFGVALIVLVVAVMRKYRIQCVPVQGFSKKNLYETANYLKENIGDYDDLGNPGVSRDQEHGTPEYELNDAATYVNTTFG